MLGLLVSLGAALPSAQAECTGVPPGTAAVLQQCRERDGTLRCWGWDLLVGGQQALADLCVDTTVNNPFVGLYTRLAHCTTQKPLVCELRA